MKKKTVSPAGSRTAPWLVLAAAAGLLDQAAKDTVERMGDDQFPQEPECLKGRVKLHKNHNDGLPFGVFRQYPELVRQVPLAAFWAAFGVFAWLAPKRGHLAEKAGLALVLGGGGSNLYDRLVRGYVVDYFSIQKGRLKKVVLNLGDCCVLAGVLILLASQIADAIRGNR